MTLAYEEGFDEKVKDINAVYKEAPERAKQGQRTESLDEMTGVQALERKYPGLPILPGKVERREFEYIRHGTLPFICNFDVASGELVACTASKTRNEKDFAEHIQRRVASDLWQLSGILSATISTFTCPNLWCGMLQKNLISISTWVSKEDPVS